MHLIDYFDITTGEQRQREATPEEVAQREQDLLAWAARVPSSIQMRQLRLALVYAGWGTRLEAAMDALRTRSPRMAEVAAVELQNATARRHSEIGPVLVDHLGFSGAEVDELFRAGVSL